MHYLICSLQYIRFEDYIMFVDSWTPYTLFDGLHNIVPIATAAVNNETYCPEENVLDMRVKTLALTFISIIGASIAVGVTMYPPAFLAGVFLIPLFFMINTYDRNLAEKASDVLAVQNYTRNETPLIHSITRIASNINAVKLLLTKTRDITKETDCGYRILQSPHLKKRGI